MSCNFVFTNCHQSHNSQRNILFFSIKLLEYWLYIATAIAKSSQLSIKLNSHGTFTKISKSDKFILRYLSNIATTKSTLFAETHIQFFCGNL